MTLDILKELGLLSEALGDTHYIPTGSYALNKVISGSYTKGVPTGYITEFYGHSSTAKTVFVTHILREAQKLGYFAALIDSENTYSAEFASVLGLDPEKLIYDNPETLEACFDRMEEIVLTIRKSNKKTPIVIGYDSLPVSPIKKELEESYAKSADNNMLGAMRAAAMGKCLRKFSGLCKKHNVCLLVVNQYRSKVGVMFGDPRTKGAGGQSLEYYLGVDLECFTSKSDGKIEDELGNHIGIKGEVRNKKNKVSIPFRECEFKLMYDEGLDPYYGLIPLFIKDKLVTKIGGWYTVVGTDIKFQKKGFQEKLLNGELGDLLDQLNNSPKRG